MSTRRNYKLNTLSFGTDGKEETKAYNVPSIRSADLLGENAIFLDIPVLGEARENSEEGR